VGCALTNTSGDICIDLRVTLSTLKIDALLLGVLLEAGPLPLGKPSLVVGLLPRVLRIKVLWVFDLSLSLAGRHEDLGTSLGLLDDIPGLLLLALLRHAIFNKVLKVVIFIRLFLARQRRDIRQCELLLDLCGLLEVD
jgi:hypothetical protein